MSIFKKRANLPKYTKYFEEEVEQLRALGYHNSQIKEMLSNSNIPGLHSPLTEEAREKIRTKLIKQIEFAKKALKNYCL